MIYLDASALVKVVAAEDESTELKSWLDERASLPLVTSLVGQVEVLRAAARHGSAATARARTVLAAVGTMALTADIAGHAAALAPPVVRTLDAFHVASAAALGSSLVALVAYDRRLLDVAQSLGLPTVSPGAAL